ncbi:UNVERIFIED_CONTAM: Polyphenol oxidase II, chloroplastic [Sesamum radiatum]|uniref:Polyphenol oxidase II, chloroplastic n=1 Tax=Sesamum radiatum TaxID=300843 RepID=A0AAW2JIK6_SESRA
MQSVATACEFSCTDSRNVETPLGKVDRRNMLLGLGGGLYGAANLISSPGALAEPVSPPQLDKCCRKIIQKIHVDSCNKPIFIALIAMVLIHMIPNPGRTLSPYKSTILGFSSPSIDGLLYMTARETPDNLKAVVDLGFTGSKNPDQLVTNNLSIVYNEMIAANADAYGFMGKPYCQGSNEKESGPGWVERGSHTAVHVFVGDPREPAGEDLGNFYSAGNPLFFCHHSNVDRMWTLWQYYLPSDQIPDKRITSRDFLEASFLFYNEKAELVRVTVEDCLDNRSMGYDFEQCDLPWLAYRPPAQTATAKVIRSRKTAPNAETVFPVNLDKIVRVLVPKTKKGKADELLVIEDITVDTTKFLKFDVFVNDEDDDLTDLDKAAYAGTYAQVPHKSGKKTNTTSISLKLTNLYNRMDVRTMTLYWLPWCRDIRVKVSPLVGSKSLRTPHLLKPQTLC